MALDENTDAAVTPPQPENFSVGDGEFFFRVLAGAKRDETSSCVVTPKETKRVGSRSQFPLKVLHDDMSFSLFGKNTLDNRSGEAPRAP